MRLRLFARFVSFRRSSEGVAAVEFGLLVPLLFIMFIGTLEIGQAVGLDRRVSMATSSVADLVARNRDGSPAEIDGIFKVAEHLLSPYESDNLKLVVFSVVADMSNPANTRVEWSHPSGASGAPSRCQAYPMPAGLLSAGSRAIIVESRYQYEPLLVSHFLNNTVVLGDKATVSPRNTCYDYLGNQCRNPCT